MKRYKVIALYVQGLRKRPFEAGEIVTDSSFYEGIADYLVEQGFIKQISEDEEKPVARYNPEVEITRRPVELPEIDLDKLDEGKDLNFTRASRNQMKQELQRVGIAFDEDESKKSLYEKWKNLR